MNRFLFNFFQLENIHKYSKIQYQGEIVYLYKTNPQKYVSSKILLVAAAAVVAAVIAAAAVVEVIVTVAAAAIKAVEVALRNSRRSKHCKQHSEWLGRNPSTHHP